MPGEPLTEKNGESHCRTSVKELPAGPVMRCMVVPPKLWGVPPSKLLPNVPAGRNVPGTNACS